MCYLKLLKLVTFQTHHGELLIWNFQMRLEKEVLFEIFETCNFSNPSWGVAYLKLSDETWNEMCYLKLLKLETFQTFKPITGVGYLKHSDKTWYEMCYLKFWNILTFSNSSWELLIWNFQMRLQTRYSIWNVWNLKLLKHVMGVAYLKLSDETWNEMCYMKLLKLETSQTCHGSCLFETFRWDLRWDVLYMKTFWNLELLKPMSWGVAYLKLSDETWKRGAIWNFSNLKLFKPIMGSCLFETFRWDLKWDVLYETFETWNFSNPSWGVAYLKLSDETWNEMCYIKLLKLETFQTHHRELLIWNFQMRLEKEVLFKTFETCNFSNPSWGVAYLKLSDETWNEMCYLKLLKLETFQTFKPITGVGYLKHSDKTWYEMCYLKFWNILTFSNSSWELLIWNFQMRLQTRYSIWNVWNLKLLKHVMGVAYLKLSDETRNKIFYLKFLKLETFQPIMGSCLFETFRWDLKGDVLFKFWNLLSFSNPSQELLIWSFQMRLEKEVLFEIFETCNFSNPSWGVAYLKLSDETWNKIFYLKCLKLETSQTCHGSCLFETFRWDLKWDVLYETFETWNFSNMSWELLIWNFQMRLEKEVLFEIFETWNFSNPSWGVAYLKLSDETWNKIFYLKCLKLVTFQIHHGELLI